MTDEEPIGEYLPPLTELQHLAFELGSAFKCLSLATANAVKTNEVPKLRAKAMSFYSKKSPRKGTPIVLVTNPRHRTALKTAIATMLQNTNSVTEKLMGLDSAERRQGFEWIAKRLLPPRSEDQERPFQREGDEGRKLKNNERTWSAIWLSLNASASDTDFDHKFEALQSLAKQCWSDGVYFLNPLAVDLFIAPGELKALAKEAVEDLKPSVDSNKKA